MTSYVVEQLDAEKDWILRILRSLSRLRNPKPNVDNNFLIFMNLPMVISSSQFVFTLL